MKVRCVDNNSYTRDLTIYKTYEVLREDKSVFYIIDDVGIEFGYNKSRFEIVEEEKEEFTFTEVIARIKSGEEYVCAESFRDIESISRYDDKTTVNFKENGCHIAIRDKAKFKLKKPEYMTFLEAKEKGIPKHKDFFLGYFNSENNMEDFIEEMDKKVWTIEGEE